MSKRQPRSLPFRPRTCDCSGFSGPWCGTRVLPPRRTNWASPPRPSATTSRRLEERFGIRLCERGRKGFSLTADGGRILDAAETLLRSVENFTGIVGSVKGELSGTVHLGIVDAMHTNRDVPLHKAIGAFVERGAAGSSSRRDCLAAGIVAAPRRWALWRNTDADRGASSIDRRPPAVPGGAAALLRTWPPPVPSTERP